MSVTGYTKDATDLAVAAAVAAEQARANGAYAPKSLPTGIGLGMPGTATVRASTVPYVLPESISITGFQARVNSGSGTVVQLTKNGTAVGSASSGLTTAAAATSFGAVAASRGDLIGLTITTAGTGADVSVTLDAVFTG